MNKVGSMEELRQSLQVLNKEGRLVVMSYRRWKTIVRLIKTGNVEGTMRKNFGKITSHSS